MSGYDVKQVILLRTDLNMRKGKMAAQAAHASMAVVLNRIETWQGELATVHMTPDMVAWCSGKFAKIVLGVQSENDLRHAYHAARSAGIPAALITDAGFTEFHGVPTVTAVAIGPAKVDAIDAITGREGIVETRLL